MKLFDILEENQIKKIRSSKNRFLEFGEYNLLAIPTSTKPEVLALLPNSTIVVANLRKFVSDSKNDYGNRSLTTVSRNLSYDKFYDTLVEEEQNIKKGLKSIPGAFETEFIPGKFSEYYKPNVRDQPVLTARLKFLTEKYETELGIPMKDLFAELDADYTLKNAAQRSAAIKITTNSAAYKNILSAFQDQESKNLYVTAGAYATEPATAKSFFKPSVLHPRHKNRQGVEILKPLIVTIRPESIYLTDFAYLQTDKILLGVRGENSIFYFSSDVELVNNIIPFDAIEVAGGDELVIEGSTLKTFFYLANKETSTNVVAELSLM